MERLSPDKPLVPVTVLPFRAVRHSLDLRPFLDTFTRIWERADPRAPPCSEVFDPPRQARCEDRLTALVDAFLAEAARRSASQADWSDAQRRLAPRLDDLASEVLGWPGERLHALPGAAFREQLERFPAVARRFDPALATTDIYQAGRNALTMHCLQHLLGVPVRLTPSVFAYSLLYPYTDNYLDDAGLEHEEKLDFSARFARRLLGDSVAPSGEYEAQVFRLVGLIEREFDRSTYPDVYRALLAIHAAQERSLALFDLPDEAVSQVMEICFLKGGASVLADGYLVAGSLTRGQAECIFGLGVFLQLRDDLEDVVSDREDHQQTPFSVGFDDGLDAPTARTLALGRSVFAGLGSFCLADDPVVELIGRTLPLTVIDAAASLSDHFSRPFLTELERRSPCRLTVLAEQRARLQSPGVPLTRLLAAWLAASCAIPSSVVGAASVADIGAELL